MAKCNRLGCLNKAETKGFCLQHTSETNNSSKRRRETYQRLYDTAQWKQLRLIHLDRHPLCIRCNNLGYIKPAKDVDHVIPHKGDLNLFYDMNNLQSLCKSCHTWKTNKERKTGQVVDFRI